MVKAFLKEAANRIKALQAAESKMGRRWSKLLVWLGLPPHLHAEYPPHGLAKTLADFSLQYKLEWDRVAAGEVKERTRPSTQRRSAPDLGRAEGIGELEVCLADMVGGTGRGIRRDRRALVQEAARAQL